MNINILFDVNLDPQTVRIAAVWGTGLKSTPQDQPMPDFLRESVAAVRSAGDTAWPATRRARVRDMLRYGKFRPTGRAKPASEFLLGTAQGDNPFPSINGPADINNAVSLLSGFPASVFDAAITGTDLLIRRGQATESYVFNTSGQIIDLQDLIIVCRREDEQWIPCGNPIKDSMETKVGAQTRDVIAVIYFPVDESDEEVNRWSKRFAELLQTHCGCVNCGVITLSHTCHKSSDT